MRKRIVFGLLIVAATYALRIVLRDEPGTTSAITSPVDRAVASEAPAAVTASVATPAPAPAPKPAPTIKTRSRADVPPEELLARKSRRFTGPRGTDDPGADPMQRFRGLRMSDPRKLGPRGYRVLGARAVRVDRYTSALGPVLFEEFGRRVVADVGPGWGDLRTSADGQPLLVNPSNGRLALVTGTIEAALPNVEAAESLAAQENLTLVNYDRAIGLAYFKAPADFALAPALERIGARPGVGQVELELVESRKVAQ